MTQPQPLTQDIGPPVHPVYFDALLTPHRSLGPRGFAVLMAGLALVSFIAGAAFVSLGAWPVTGFFGLDLALVYLAFRLNYRGGRLTELVRLDAHDLIVRRVTPRGAVYAWRFEPTWVRVERWEAPPALALRSHGRRLVLGRHLNEEERDRIAQRLTAALAAWTEDLTRRP